MRNITLALAGAATLLVPVAASAQQNPLSSIFSCQNSNNRQQTGAIAGGLLGGLLGNQVAGDDDQTLGTVLGAALGAAAGSYIGCQMSSDDTNQAQSATLNALNQNRSTTWTNARTGASGRVDIVNSFNRQDPSAPQSNNNNNNRNDQGRGYGRGDNQASLNNVQFARGVQTPSGYTMIDSQYRARSNVNVRSSPDTRAGVLTTLRNGETFDALARVNNSDWLLASRNGVAIGYVSASVVTYVGENDRRGSPGRGPDRGRDTGPTTLQTVQFQRGVQTPTNYSMVNSRYTARNNVNIRSAPNPRGSVLGQFRAGETFDVLARVNSTEWLLASRNGVAIGYVSANVVTAVGGGYGNDQYAGNNNNNNYNNSNNSQNYQVATQVCRTFDQTVQTRTARATTERFTACQVSGEWVVTA